MNHQGIISILRAEVPGDACSCIAGKVMAMGIYAVSVVAHKKRGKKPSVFQYVIFNNKIKPFL